MGSGGFGSDDSRPLFGEPVMYGQEPSGLPRLYVEGRHGNELPGESAVTSSFQLEGQLKKSHGRSSRRPELP